MENKQRKSSDAQIKASAKYDAKAYQKKLVRFKPEQWEKFKKWTAEKSYSDNGAIINAVMYCIDNNIDLSADNNNEE